MNNPHHMCNHLPNISVPQHRLNKKINYHLNNHLNNHLNKHLNPKSTKNNLNNSSSTRFHNDIAIQLHSLPQKSNLSYPQIISSIDKANHTKNCLKNRILSE